MTYVLQLAAHTDLPVQTVLRVLLRQPTNEAAQKKVAEAVALIGLPDYPRPDGHIEVLPDVGTALEPASAHLEAPEAELEPTDQTQELVTEFRGAVQQLLGGSTASVASASTTSRSRPTSSSRAGRASTGGWAGSRR